MAFIRDIEKYRERTLARDLIIGLTVAVGFTVAVHIAVYYVYSTTSSERILTEKAESTVDELAEVMAISLWNLSRDVIVQISKAYLKSAYLEGIQIKDDLNQVMFEAYPENTDGLIKETKEIEWQGNMVGTLTLWITGKDTTRIQRAMIRNMILIALSVIIIIIGVIHFIMRYLLNKPMDHLIQGMRTIAGGDYQSPMPPVPQVDINAIIKEANLMASQIALRNEQLEKENIERSKAQDELKHVNVDLEMRIGQLIEAEKALAESEKKYRGIFENALEGIFQTTPDGRFIDANPSMAQILGYDSPEDLINSVTNIEKQHYVDPHQREEYLRLLGENDLISHYECQFYKKDGTKIWGVTQVRGFRDDQGKLTRLEGILQDISERKQAEIELRESEEKYRQLYEGSRDGYVMTDTLDNFIECNSSFCEMLGYTLEELRQMTYPQITPEKYHDWETQLLQKETLERGYTDVYEKDYIRKDGTVFPVEMRAYLMRPQKDKATGFWAFVRDITERKKLQAEAMRNAQLASLGEMAAGVAHEINNPINGIINYAQILINRSKKTGDTNDIPPRIIQEGIRIERIVRALLSFSRESREKKFAVQIKHVLTESLDLTQSMLAKDKINISVNLPGDLPEINANAQQIQQVFLNMISNARYALNQKAATSSIEKRLVIDGEIIENNGRRDIRISVYDNGTGIAKKDLARVCDPFFSTKPTDQGTGLGLSISHGIVKNHDGKLWMESVEGDYTKAIIELPI
ncbi:MAG: PAS domain S-box protein [Desulfobacteraceae bacterium]|nr:PAS domain S-box protein [Desulfobacteraceae bacterium]